jgi:hypothetical protein
MTIRCALLLAVCGWTSSGSISRGVAAPRGVAATSNAMALLPASSRHVFGAAPRSWTRKVEYLRLQSNKVAFIVLDSSTRPNGKTDWRQVSYFDNPREKDPNGFRKIRRFRPDGTLALEIDRTATEQFDRTFAPDGTVISYEHLRGYQRIARYDFNLKTKKVSHFSGGHGDWIERDEGGSEWTHNWVHGGNFYLIKKGESGRIVETRLIVAGKGEVQISATGEKLFLFSLHERWHKPNGQPVSAQIDDYHINGEDASVVKNNFPDDEIKRRIRASQTSLISRFRFRGGPLRKRDPGLQQQLEKDYLQRRARFLTEYEAVLKSASQTWDSFGLKRLSPLG